MHLIGTFIGFLVAIAIKPNYALAGAFLGWVIAAILQSRLNAAYAPAKETVEKINRLEHEIERLNLLLEQQGTTQAAPIAKPDVVEAAKASDSEAGWGEKAMETVRPAPASIPMPEPHVLNAPPADMPAQPLPEIAALREVASAFELPAMPDWIARLWSGNPLAKVGIVFLFFAIASGLKLAAEYGFMPIWVRLLATATCGAGLIVFGFRKAQSEDFRNFGLAIQGGGFAILYLVAYFMLQRYGMISREPAFGIFAVLGVACMLMATRQDGPALAVLGIAGAFLAPVLAGGNSTTPLPLFSYFALLNVMVIGVSWFRSWKPLNITGFILTLAICMSWAVERYQDQHFLVTEIFTVIFLIAYSAMPAATALFKAQGKLGWQDGILLFGTPLMGVFLQSRLMEGTEYGLAWSAFIGSLWYFALWLLLFKKGDESARFFERAHLGISLALFTVAIPLAFDAKVTSAFWAAEGAAALWFGVRQKRMLSQAAGLLMQLAAGAELAAHWDVINHRLPVFNDAVFGAFIITLAGLFSARLLRSFESCIGKDYRIQPIPPVMLVIWSLLWWFGTGISEIDRFAAPDDKMPFVLFFVVVTVLLLEGVARVWAWPNLRGSALLLPGAAWFCLASTFIDSGHPLPGLMAPAFLVATLVAYLQLALHEKRGEEAVAPLCPLRHISLWWLVLWVLPAEITWRIQQIAPGIELWRMVTWGIAMASGMLLPIMGRQREIWPFANPAARYIPEAVLAPAILMAGLLATSSFGMSGAGSGLPYLPVLNPFDLTQLFGIWALFMLARVVEPDFKVVVKCAVAGLAFVWCSTLAARIAHFWGGIPFERQALSHSLTFQSLLTIIWTSIAIGTMITASRRALRQLWFGGFGLLGIVCAKLLLFDASGRGTLTWTGTLMGVAILILAASYFAPVPPKEAAQ